MLQKKRGGFFPHNLKVQYIFYRKKCGNMLACSCQHFCSQFALHFAVTQHLAQQCPEHILEFNSRDNSKDFNFRGFGLPSQIAVFMNRIQLAPDERKQTLDSSSPYIFTLCSSETHPHIPLLTSTHQIVPEEREAKPQSKHHQVGSDAWEEFGKARCLCAEIEEGSSCQDSVGMESHHVVLPRVQLCCLHQLDTGMKPKRGQS